MTNAAGFVSIRWLTRYSAVTHDFFVRILRGFAWPKTELLFRLWLAKIFFTSGMLKLTHWDTALELAAHEYPVSFMSPVSAAYVGVSIEVLGAVLLALGLMTRYAAFALLALTLVIQYAYKEFENQLFWAAMFGWFAINGAGPLSMDNLLRRGLANSALPGARALLAFSRQLRLWGTRWYLSLLRLWMALALLAGGVSTRWRVAPALLSQSSWLPLDATHALPWAGTLISGLLLFLGLGTRYVAAVMIVILSADRMMSPQLVDAMYLFMVFSILVIYGGGIVSVDQMLATFSMTLAQKLDARDSRSLIGLPRVVIIGAGFGGVSCAAHLRGARVSVTLVDRENYHLFQPLLYQVATAGLSPADIAAPVRTMFRDSFGIRVLLGDVTEIDTRQQLVQVGTRAIPYDYLVLATGASHSYFGNDAWESYAPGLKRIEDAIEIRRRILTAFERAEAVEDADARASLLTFLVVGGGPTGVELAGAIAELARYGMEKEFRTFDPASARIILVQSGARLLPAFPESLSTIAQRSLEALGVEVRLHSRVQAIDAEGVAVDGQRIPAKTVLWAAGVAASPAASWLGADADASGRIKVGPELGVPGLKNVFAIGDTALSNGWHGHAVPGLAPAAKQAGAYVAKCIRAAIEMSPIPAPFKYKHLGSLATIGRKAAVADFGFAKIWGAPAWWLWGFIHIGFLVGLRSRFATLVNWFWAYLTFGSGIRLITHTKPAETDAIEPIFSSKTAESLVK